MKIICVVKFVPDVESFVHDYEHGTLDRDRVRMILNPDDACALSFALRVKDSRPGTRVEIVTMAPTSIVPHMQDLLRLAVDTGTIISDPVFAGSDTHVTSEILSRYLATRSYDVILTGSRSLDGATSHVPGQLAESLGLDHLLDIIQIDPEQFDEEHAVIQVEDDGSIITYEMDLPGVLSLTRSSGYTLPYVTYEALQRDVSEKLTIVSNDELLFGREEVGLQGSLTRVMKTYAAAFEGRDRKIVHTDPEGIAFVHSFLKERGYL